MFTSLFSSPLSLKPLPECSLPTKRSVSPPSTIQSLSSRNGSLRIPAMMSVWNRPASIGSLFLTSCKTKSTSPSPTPSGSRLSKVTRTIPRIQNGLGIFSGSVSFREAISHAEIFAFFASSRDTVPRWSPADPVRKIVFRMPLPFVMWH